jgi:hypothetical protein
MSEDGKENALNQIVSFPAKFGIEIAQFDNVAGKNFNLFITAVGVRKSFMVL